MAIAFECANCGKKLKAPDEAAGKTSKCPGCGETVTCPRPGAAARPPAPAPTPVATDLDDGNPYGLVEPEPDPYAPPRAAPEEPELAGNQPGGKGKGKGKGKRRAQLRKIAVAQKGILTVILLQIAAYVAAFMLPPNLQLYPAIATLALSLASLYFIFSMAMNLYSTGMGILLCVLSLVPCINLLVLLSMNGKATKILREAGHHVGFLGANLAEFEAS